MSGHESGAPERPTRVHESPALARVRAAEQAGGPLPDPADPRVVATRAGVVEMSQISYVEDGPRSRVEVRLAGATESGEAHFVIVNPPTMVPDPNGPVNIRGENFRHDPIGAIALVIAELGGARKERKRRIR